MKAHTAMTRRDVLTLAAGLSLPTPSAHATPDAGRLVEIGADDIAWFRTAQATWVRLESGAPGIIPHGANENAYIGQLLSYPPDSTADPAAKRLEPILCAAFLNASFLTGLYRLDPPITPVGDRQAPPATAVLVRPEHITLLKRSLWDASLMDGKRPYGDLSFYEADMALALGHPPATTADGTYTLPEAELRHYQALHREMLLVVQAYVQHAALTPGTYTIPRDGWASPFMPRCEPLPPAQLARYQAFCATHPIPQVSASDPAALAAYVIYAAEHFQAKAALFATTA